MSQNTPCERCGDTGFVRVERIINGTAVTLAYECGRCDHSWRITAPDQRQPVRATLRLKKDRKTV
jgi:hypothetical protein